jgi:S1-C subfamily serine protease
MLKSLLIALIALASLASGIELSLYSVDEEGLRYPIQKNDTLLINESIKIEVRSDHKQILDLYFVDKGIKTLMTPLITEPNQTIVFPPQHDYVKFDTEGQIQLEITESGNVINAFPINIIASPFPNNNSNLSNSSISSPLSERKYSIAPTDIITNDRGAKEKTIYKQLIQKTVAIETDKGEIGAGVLIDRGQILTSWHVIKNSRFISIAFRPERTTRSAQKNTYLTAKVLKYDITKDLALLQIIDSESIKNIKPISLANIDKMEIGEDVFTIGHPEGELFSFDSGLISQIHKNYTWKTKENHQADYVIQVKNSISNGNSGGPLVNENLELIGLNTFSNVRGQNLNFAVSSTDIKTFLASKQPSKQKNTALKQVNAHQNIIDTKKGFDTNQTPITTYFIDTNKDGRADLVTIDVGRNGIYNYYFYDFNQDGKVDKVCYDKNGDAIIERCLVK